MITIDVNGRHLEAESGEILLPVLKRNHIDIPTLCYMEDMLPTGACRMCVVEVDGQGPLVPSCAFPVQDGIKIHTHSQRVLDSRKTILELLLASHPEDCFYCERNQSCKLQTLAQTLGVREKRFHGDRNEGKLDVSSPSIVRDPNKCILCGRCVRVCEEIQSVSAIDFIGRGWRTRIGTALDRGLNVSSCINCGQCVMVCPTGALREKSCVQDLLSYLSDPQKTVIVQHAPAVSITLGEMFGFKEGVDVAGYLHAALRKMGFARVFDTSFSADLTIMEEGSELVHRIQSGGVLPMLTSCSPGWIKFVEQFYPEFIPNVSTCKSPQQMMGALIKRYYAPKQGLDPHNIVSVSIMPCTAKKFEAQRPEMAENGLPDIDMVLTTRELASAIRLFGIDLPDLDPEDADDPLGERSGAGKIFGATGGVMEAALRSVHFLLTGENPRELEVKEVRSLRNIKEAKVTLAGMEIGVAVTSGLQNARTLLDQIKLGRKDLHFIEVMTCPGGCIAGGGQPLDAIPRTIESRLQGLYNIDESETLRLSHENPSVHQLYKEFLGQPLGEKSHHLLHTSYTKREAWV